MSERVEVLTYCGWSSSCYCPLPFPAQFACALFVLLQVMALKAHLTVKSQAKVAAKKTRKKLGALLVKVLGGVPCRGTAPNLSLDLDAKSQAHFFWDAREVAAEGSEGSLRESRAFSARVPLHPAT